ncbi:TetR/AcrR family transcriptional regulator [Lentilitoribacter sp. Alg239-R112]|uniref:TetR/AcrR family transcriptional regulator n=1 Tax=Lentilitoribacter sp. Alg239-R112 TaxID=2305987 RepID=UPI0013A6BF40|nr:TetR/AcrR family transcriptional regulator [Lentilitoribacter sp. Alg239-R112]
MDKAVEFIAKNGVENLSLRQLARELGVSHGAPARHFSNKAALLTAVATKGYSDMIVATQKVAQKHEDKDQIDLEDLLSPPEPCAHLRAMIKADVEWAKSNPKLFMAMRNPDVTRHADDTLKSAIACLSEKQLVAIKNAQSKGWSSQIDPKMLRLQILSTIAGLSSMLCDPFYHEFLVENELEDFIDHTIDNVLRDRKTS